MSSKLLEVVESLDLFKRPLFLYLGQKKFNGTVLGILLSLAIYGFLMHSFFISDMFTKKNPLIYDQGLVTQSRPELKFNFSMPLYVANSAGEKFYEPSIFKVNVINYDMITDPATNNGKVPRFAEKKELKLCEPSDFENQEEFYKQGFKNAFCMKSKNVSLSGYWEESGVKYLHTYVERCNNITSDVVCKSDQEIDDFFGRKFYGIQMPNTFFDMNDYDEAIKYTWRTEYQLIDVNMMKRLKLFIKKVEFNDDKGYLFEDKHEKNTFTYDYTEIDFKNQNRSAIMFEIFLYSSSVIQKKVRKYQKASEVLAAIGGQASCLMIFGFILTSLPNFVEMTSKLINNLYSFPEQSQKQKEEKGRKKQKNNQKYTIKGVPPKKGASMSKSLINNDTSLSGVRRQSGAPPEGNQILNNDKLNTDIRDLDRRYNGYVQQKHVENESCELEAMTLEFVDQNQSRMEESRGVGSPVHGIKKERIMEIIEQEGAERNKIKFGVEDFLKMNFSRFFKRKLGFKDRLFLKAQERFINEIDILNILRRLQDLEKLKLILLSPQQQDLFTLLQKPMILIDEHSSARENEGLEDSVNARMSVMLGSIHNSQRGKNSEELKKTQQRAVKYYRSLKANKKRSDVENRLLNYIDERLKEADENY